MLSLDMTPPLSCDKSCGLRMGRGLRMKKDDLPGASSRAGYSETGSKNQVGERIRRQAAHALLENQPCQGDATHSQTVRARKQRTGPRTESWGYAKRSA